MLANVFIPQYETKYIAKVFWGSICPKVIHFSPISFNYVSSNYYTFLYICKFQLLYISLHSFIHIPSITLLNCVYLHRPIVHKHKYTVSNQYISSVLTCSIQKLDVRPLNNKIMHDMKSTL